MLISRRQAIKIFKQATGRSVVYTRQAINKLPKEPDGKLKKVRVSHLDDLISKANQVTTKPSVRTVRPINDRRAQQIRERCI